jgi:hypothetical protein
MQYYKQRTVPLLDEGRTHEHFCFIDLLIYFICNASNLLDESLGHIGNH